MIPSQASPEIPAIFSPEFQAGIKTVLSPENGTPECCFRGLGAPRNATVM
jgi:hypothetical protein